MANDFSAAVTALQTIQQFPGQISTAASTVASVPLGPWYIGVNCNYGPCNRANATYGAVLDYNQSRDILLGLLQNVSGITQNFTNQMKTEINGLKNATLEIMGALAQVLGQYQNPDFNKKQDTISFLNIIIDTINQQLPVLTSDNQSIAAFSKQLSDTYAQLVNAKDNLYNLNGQVNSSTEQLIVVKPCGKDVAYSQLNIYEAMFYDSYNAINGAINTLSGQAQNTLNAVAVVSGSFSVFATQWNGGLQDVIKAADANAYNQTLQKFDAGIALDQWNDLYNELEQINF